MGARGPKPMPGNVHMLRGNPSKKPLGSLFDEFRPEVEIPSFPSWLWKEAKKEWKRVGFDAEMLIAECSWILDKEGLRTEIKVGPPDGYLPYVHCYNNSAKANFGQRAWAKTCPTGFDSPSCTKKLPINPAGGLKSVNAFIAKVDTGANIQSAVAAARANWPGYIDIFKRREASEGWRWVFSDDPTNHLDTTTTNAKAAIPALAGTSYVGYSLKVSAANGVATGTFVHTNGANSVISDGLSNVRKMIILHRESAGGGAFFEYHPDLTAGKLLYLNTTAAETTDASIKSVTAGGFTADSTLPSGTYRWVSIAETEGLIKLTKHTGNGSSTDGAYAAAGLCPALAMIKECAGTNAATSSHVVYDAAREPTNHAGMAQLSMNLPAVDASPYDVDLVSGGFKTRSVTANLNESAGIYVGLMIAAFPFRYANAR